MNWGFENDGSKNLRFDTVEVRTELYEEVFGVKRVVTTGVLEFDDEVAHEKLERRRRRKCSSGWCAAIDDDFESIILNLRGLVKFWCVNFCDVLPVHDKDNVYLKGKDKIVTPFRFGVEDVATKMWFHKLAYPGQCLTNSAIDSFLHNHLDIIFYYLRKKGKYAKEPKVKFTTTDCLFFKTIHALYEKIVAKKKDLSLIIAQHAIADYISRRKMLCGSPWHLCDHILFIIHMESESHWIFGRLNIEERRMYMYNSLSTAMKDSAAIKACQPFAVLLSHFFALFDEFKKENKPVSLDPFEVVKVDGLPQQTSNFSDVVFGLFSSDCGCFVASFVEYFIDMKPIPPIFDVEKYRDRLAVLFIKYARMKEVNFIDSEDEAPPKGPKKNLFTHKSISLTT
ncbi:hypothetical protein F8388_022709 [Cannabis sativa]|uniref:Ubiquitin-like protease family profile domain-containing protein n=1 Tax=Cannabis sativa TaxID=3483 RepID=A0A7J6G1X4_CANSA|nr:hypothetical protein F8388_022709 [Cannabis sativa]